MSYQFFNLFLVLGVVFGVLAGLMAYLITYGEYVHHYQTTKEPKKFAWDAAIFAFCFFLLLTLAIGYFLLNYVIQ